MESAKGSLVAGKKAASSSRRRRGIYITTIRCGRDWVGPGAVGSGQWAVSIRKLRSHSSGQSFCRSAFVTRTQEGRLKAVKKNENSVTGAKLRLSGKAHKASIQQAKLDRPSGPRQVSGAASPGASIV